MTEVGTTAYDVEQLRKDFPILERRVHDNQPLVYLDSANTSQKPRQVLDALAEFYEQHNSNIHRATHALGEEATAGYEGARLKVAAFIGAPDADTVIFTKNSTEALNLVANVMAWGSRGLKSRRRSRHHRDGAPLQHRAVADPVRAHRRDVALVRCHRRWSTRYLRYR